jgi:hypothetical protein
LALLLVAIMLSVLALLDQPGWWRTKIAPLVGDYRGEERERPHSPS